ncbi:MAG TPA: hypothetical protein VGF93_19475 [Solirubrobacteraceae bacterium]
MPSYLVESYVPRVRVGEIDGLTIRAREAAEGLAREGNDVRYLRSSFLPEDEMWLLWFDAPTPELVGAAGQRAELDFARIVETVE